MADFNFNPFASVGQQTQAPATAGTLQNAGANLNTAPVRPAAALPQLPAGSETQPRPRIGGLTPMAPPPPGSGEQPQVQPGGTPAGAPGGTTFAAPNPSISDPFGTGGQYEAPHQGVGGNAPIAEEGAYNIGPNYGYAFDAGTRSLQSGYDAAGQLANVGNQAATLGVAGGQQVGALAQDYGGQMATEGFRAQAATQQYEDILKGYRGQSLGAGDDAAQIGLAGQQAAAGVGAQMGTQGGQFVKQGAQAATQNIADVNLKASQDAMRASGQYANQLAGIGAKEGPSAAQAQLQSAVNQSQQANLAMARSGRGWGGSASAQTQALAANAAAGQQAANQSAILRAQEEQQRQQMLSQNVGNAAQIQQASANTALSQQQLAAQTNIQEAQVQAQRQQALYGLGLQSQQQGAELGLQGAGLALQGNQAQQQAIAQAGQFAGQGAGMDLAGRQAYIEALGQGGSLATQGAQAGAELGLQGLGQGAGAYAQGVQMAQGGELQAMQFAAQQQQAQQARANAALQQYGIQRGVAIQQAQSTNQLIGSGIQAAASLGGAAMLLSDRRAKEDIKPAQVDLRPQSNYQLAGAAAGAAPVAATNPGVTGGAGAAGSGIAKDEADKKAGMGMLMSGIGQLADGFKGQPMNPVLAQSLQGVGASPMISDKRAKTDIAALDKAGSEAVQAINQSGKTGQLAALDNTQRDNIMAIRNANGMSPTSAFDAAQAYSYNYKQPEKYGEGEFIGLMAQDLEKTPAGATAISKQPNGLMAVDMNRLGMLTAAAQSQTQQRQDDMEEKLARLQRRVLSSQANADGTY